MKLETQPHSIISSPGENSQSDFEDRLMRELQVDDGPVIFTNWAELKAAGYDTKTNFLFDQRKVPKPGEHSTAKYIERRVYTEARWAREVRKFQNQCKECEQDDGKRHRLERLHKYWNRLKVSRLENDRIEVISREIPVFHKSQMREGNFRERTKAIIKYGNIFWRPAKKSNYIKKNPEPDKYDAKWFTKDFDKRTFEVEPFAFFSERKLREHLNQHNIYGVKPDENKPQWWGAIDLDLHIEKGGVPDIFLKQVEAVLSFLHGKGWIICLGTDLVDGIHVLKIFDEPKPLPTVQQEMEDVLIAISNQHPELEEEAIDAGMKPIREAEIFPSVSRGFRLPLGIHYTALIDKPLTLVKYHTYKGVPLFGADVVSLMNWNGTEMPLEAKLAHIRQRVPTDSKDATTKAKKSVKKGRRHEREKDASIKRDDKGLLGQLRGRYRQVLVDFYSGKMQVPKSLQTGILLGANALWAQDFPYEDRAEYLLERLQSIEITNPLFSSRLNNCESDTILYDIHHIVDTSEEIRKEPVADEQIAKSNKILRRWAAAMEEAGFVFGDPSTWQSWHGTGGKEDTFYIPSEEDIEIIENYIAPVFRCDPETAVEAVVKIVTLAAIKDASGDGMAQAYRRAVLTEYGIPCEHNSKLAECWKAVEEAGFIYTRAGHIFHRDGSMNGRARAYAPGKRVRQTNYQHRLNQGFRLNSRWDDVVQLWLETGWHLQDEPYHGRPDPEWEVWAKCMESGMKEVGTTSPPSPLIYSY